MSYRDSSHNKLSHVSTDMFKNLRKLKYLNISNNQIDTIAKDAFAALENLIELSVHTIHFTSSHSRNMNINSLRFFRNLEHNWIHTLTSSVFESLKSLNHLYLQHNNISDVQTSALEGLQSIIVA